MKPFTPSATNPFICAVAQDAGIFQVDLTATPPSAVRITGPGQFVYPTGMAAAGPQLVVCDPGQPEVGGLQPYWSRVRPFQFDVVIHFADSQLPADQSQRPLVLAQAVGNIRTIIDDQKPAHTVWDPDHLHLDATAGRGRRRGALMTASGIQRTEYWNLSQPGTVRAGATGHGESLTDMESYLLPMDQARGSGMYSWGVADGLAVQATAGASGLTIAPGTALDVAGRLIVLTPGGTAITDPAIDPAQVQGVPTVPVDSSGVTLATANAGTDCLLTLTWHEVVGQSALGNAPTLLHAPWLRLEPAAGFADTGAEVVLAEVTMDGDGNVTGLSAGRRRLVGIPAGRLELRIPRAAAGPALSVDQQAAAQLSADDGGGLVVTLLSGATPQTALAIDGQTGQVTVPGIVSAAGAVRVTSAQGHAYQMSSGPDGWHFTDTTAGADRLTVDGQTGQVTVPGTVSAAGALRVTSTPGHAYQMSSGTDGWHFTDSTAGADRLVISQGGNVGVGVGPQQTARTVHVEGSEVHSGGGGGGFSFTDRQTGQLCRRPVAR